MKIKNLVMTTLIFIFLALVVSLIVGFAATETPVLIARTVKSYKICSGIKIFCGMVPAVIATSFLLGWTFDFGSNYEGSRYRFSTAMFTRYKFVLVSALCLVFALTVFSEIVNPAVDRKMNMYREMPRLFSDYKKFAANLYRVGRYELSYEYARLAVEIDPKDKDVHEIMDKAEIAAKNIDTVPRDFSSIDMSEILPSEKDLSVTAQDTSVKNEISDSYRLLLEAEKAYQNGEYFNAHYYAKQAIAITNERDVNYTLLNQTASMAWNEITKARFEGTSDEQKIYARKYEGYTSLLEKDNLHAYYVFKTLSDSGKKLSLDPDIARYLEIAESRLEKQYFFTDETINLQNFESARNVKFKINRKDGNTDVFFIKGITATGKKANLIQYLRGVSIFTIDKDGNYISGSYTPYAKMKEISASFFDENAKKDLGLSENLKTVPYIILNSVDRRNEGHVYSSILRKGEKQFTQNGYAILPMEFKDFNLLKEASAGSETMQLSSAMKFTKIAEKYGYSKEVFTQSVCNRLLYPMFLLICFMALGIGAWHGRLPPNSIFKFKWIVVFPIFIVIDYGLYRFCSFVFKLTNYSVLGLLGSEYGILASSIFYAMVFAILSVMFNACKNSMRTQ